MFARVSRFTDGLEERLDEGITIFRDAVLPQLEKQPGFSGAALLADRERDVLFVITLWQTEDEMIAVAELDRRLADAAAKELGVTIETSSCEVA
jgi:heme-degrading monooxygenase HmoA